MVFNLRRFIKFLAVLSFFVPLVVVPSTYIFPFIVPKILLFRSLVLLMLGAYILLLVSNWKEYRPRLTGITWVVSLFFVSLAVSTFVGVDWYKSFWDNHERMLGLFTIFHFVIYYFVLTSVVKELNDWRWLLRIFLFAGSVVMFIGLLQKFNPEMLLNRGGSRVSATLGNSIYLSGYGLFLVFLAILLFFKEQGGYWKITCILCGFFGFGGIFWGGSRGTVLGLLAGLFTLLLFYIIGLKQQKKIRIAFLSILCFVVILISGLFVFRQTNFVKQIPSVGALLNSSFTEGTGRTRLMAWEIAIDAWKEKSVFGWGPNNYFYAFNKYYNPKFLEFGWGETWFDNGHSAIFNTSAVQGTVGLLLYVSLFAMPIFYLWRAWRKNAIDVHLLSISSAFFVAHFVHNAFVFENPTSYLYFFFFLAFISAQISNVPASSAGGRSIPVVKEPQKSVSWGPSGAVLVVILLLIYSTDVNPSRANKLTLGAIRLLYSNPTEALVLYEKAAQTSTPHIDDIRNDFSRTVMQLIPQLVQSKQSDLALKLLLFCLEELKRNMLVHPLDVRVHLQAADIALQLFQAKKDASYLFQAEQILTDALSKSPKRQQIQYVLAGVKLQLQKPKEALKLIQDSVDSDPNISEGWLRLATIYYSLGNLEEARATLRSAKANGLQFEAKDQSTIDFILTSTDVKK